MDSEDVFVITLRKYKEPNKGFRNLGIGRLAIDFGLWSLIFENWRIRKKK